MYRRRLNVLECIMNSYTNIPDSQYQMNTTVKEKAVLLQKYGSKLFPKKIGITLIIQSNQREKQEKSSQILKSPFRRSPHIHRDGVRGKKVFSPRTEDRITENSIMVAVSFVNRDKQVKKDMANIHFSRPLI